MAFDQTWITNLAAMPAGPDIFVTWQSTAPPGSWFQVYLNGTLAWSGQANRCCLHRPLVVSGESVWVEVGSVAPSEIHRSFRDSLKSLPLGGHVQLTWEGGTYLDPRGQDELAGFRITRSRIPGTPCDPSNVVGTVAAYPGGWITDGFGQGGFGRGRFGRAATAYSWTSPSLASGTWEFAVIPFDSQGNSISAPRTVSVITRAAPSPAGTSSDGLATELRPLLHRSAPIRAELATESFRHRGALMAISFTANLGLQKPSVSDRNWDIPLNANSDLLDANLALSNLLVLPTEFPSQSLQVRVNPGRFRKSDGTFLSFAGFGAVPLPASAITNLWLTESGQVGTGAAFPQTIHVPLATVATSAASVTSWSDARVQCFAGGASPPFLSTNGGVIQGSLTIRSDSSGKTTLQADPVANLVSFFGVAPASQASTTSSLTDQTGSAGGGTIKDVSSAYSQTLINANFAALTAKVNTVLDTLKRFGLMSS